MDQRIYRIAKLKEIVQQIIDERKEGKTPEQVVRPIFKTISMNLGPNTAVIVPDTAISADGSVDFVFTLKALSPGDSKGAANTGVNAVFITCYVPEQGSSEHQKRFGNPDFINSSIGSILSYLKQQTGRNDLKQGKVGVVGWSGGGPAITQLLSSGYKPNSVVILDGLHSNNNPQIAAKQLAATKQFAELAAKEPDKYRFTTVSTGVLPGTYRSTAETSEDVANAIKMQPSEYRGPGAAPYAVQQNGGAQWIQLYQPNEKNVDKMKEQHAHAFWWGAGNANLQHLLGWDDGKINSSMPSGSPQVTTSTLDDTASPPVTKTNTKPSTSNTTLTSIKPQNQQAEHKFSITSGWSIVPENEITNDMAQWSKELLSNESKYPTWSVEEKQFNGTTIRARIEWRQPDEKNNDVHRGVIFYKPKSSLPTQVNNQTEQEESKPIETTSANKTIFIGDSLMVGMAKASNFGKGYNCFKGGMPTAWMLNQFRTNYLVKDTSGKYKLAPSLKGKVDSVVVMGGVNDLSGQAPASKVIANLNEIYRLAREAGLKVVACTLTDWNQEKGIDSFKENYRKHKWGQYTSSAETLKKRTEEVNSWIMSQNDPSNGIVAVDTYTPTQDTSKYIKSDFVHFYGDSYALIANLIASKGGIV